MTLLEVAKHALEAMEDAMYRADTHEFYDAKESLRYAIEQAEQAEQEPVAWGYELATTVGEHGYEGWSRRVTHAKPNVPKGSIRNLTPLYTAPTPRKPLTDEEIKAALVSIDPETKRLPPGFRDFARAIEKAHGIGDNDAP